MLCLQPLELTAAAASTMKEDSTGQARVEGGRARGGRLHRNERRELELQNIEKCIILSPAIIPPIQLFIPSVMLLATVTNSVYYCNCSNKSLTKLNLSTYPPLSLVWNNS
ncbi:hypothetical protein Dimus_030671 [Dionaea muscipula]